ncbi:MAG: hypothetical protein H6509_01500 [Bryobacterales bacterium]|nr:hypothetical protein [Bryobacterales bacterium]
MTRRELLGALGALPFSVAGLAAADFWEKSEFTDWNEKDVQKMLFDSPWAQKALFARPQMGGGEGGGQGGMRGGGRPDGSGGAFGVEGGGAGGGRRGGGGGFGGGQGGGPGGGGMMQMSLYVRWNSALPVKRAMAAGRLQAEGATLDEEMQKFLSRQETHYVLNVVGLPARMQRMTEDTERLKQTAVLHIKDREPIVASGAQAQAVGEQLSLFFLFPREGNPIRLDDKEVEFVMKLGGGRRPQAEGAEQAQAERPMRGGGGPEIKSKFKLKDMVYEGELAL